MRIVLVGQRWGDVEICGARDVDYQNERGAWYESPTELDGSFDFEHVNIGNNVSTHSAPVSLRSPSPPASPTTQTPKPKDRSAAWTFGAIGRTPISQALASSVWSNLPSAKRFNKNKDKDPGPCPTPKAILKKSSSSTDTSETASIMSSGTTSLWLTDSLSCPHSPTPTTSTRVSKRVTWSDPDVLPTRKPRRVSMNIRRHSTDAVDQVTMVASNFASLASQISIPRPRRRYVEEYEYWSSSEEEDERPPMPDIDWVAYGRVYTEEDALREFPLKRERVHVRNLPSSRSSSDTLVGSFRRRNSLGDDDDVCHWDARRVVTPAWLLEGKYRPKSTRPVFEEDDEDVRTALLLPHDRPDSVALGIRASQELLSSELLSSLESSTSVVDEALLTPSTSMLLPPASPGPGKPETTELPDGAVVIVPKLMRVWPRPPFRAYTGSSDNEGESAGSVLTASMVVGSVLIAFISIAAAT